MKSSHLPVLKFTMQQAPQEATFPAPATHRFCALAMLFLACMTLLPAQPQTDPIPGSRQVIDRTVVLADAQPRRITLPAVTAGSEIRVTVESRPSRKSQAAAPVQVEILRVTGFGDQVPPNLQQATLRSVLLARTPLAGDMVYRSATGGTYLVALRRTADTPESVIARTRVQLLQADAVTGNSQVRTLSSSAQSAVAIFSAALLWTTLLLCGAPIVRAFRSRRSDAEPPLYG